MNTATAFDYCPPWLTNVIHPDGTATDSQCRTWGHAFTWYPGRDRAQWIYGCIDTLEADGFPVWIPAPFPAPAPPVCGDCGATTVERTRTLAVSCWEGLWYVCPPCHATAVAEQAAELAHYQAAATAAPMWQPANNGTGKRIWFLIATDRTCPSRSDTGTAATGTSSATPPTPPQPKPPSASTATPPPDPSAPPSTTTDAPSIGGAPPVHRSQKPA